MEILLVCAQALWFILPALAPSSGAVLVGGGAPIDSGRKMKDGNRILGNGKTWRGLFGGTLVGILLGVILNSIALYIMDSPEWAFSESWGTALFILFLLAFGSMMGDLIGSFIKRRMGKKKGEKFPVLDQYDFLIGTSLFIIPFQSAWFLANYIDGLHIFGLIFILILIPLLHRVTNIAGFKMGKKEVPW